MIKIILIIVITIIIFVAFYYTMIPRWNKEQKKEKHDWWIRSSKSHTAMNEQVVTLDWNTVLSLYHVNPERWYFDKNDMILYRTDEARVYTVLLSYEDYWLYQTWLKRKKQEEADSREREAIKDILKCGQRDIDSLRESIKEDLKKVEDTTNEIKERLEKE